MADHLVKVPPELFTEWLAKALLQHDAKSGEVAAVVADRAAQWGWDQRESEVQEQADQELEAVEHWLITGPYGASIAASAPNLVADLRAAMRPKPPTLAEQGMEALSAVVDVLRLGFPGASVDGFHIQNLTAALNRLKELEAQQ